MVRSMLMFRKIVSLVYYSFELFGATVPRSSYCNFARKLQKIMKTFLQLNSIFIKISKVFLTFFWKRHSYILILFALALDCFIDFWKPDDVISANFIFVVPFVQKSNKIHCNPNQLCVFPIHFSQKNCMVLIFKMSSYYADKLNSISLWTNQSYQA